MDQDHELLSDGKCHYLTCSICYPPPRHDDSEWALPTREPEKQVTLGNINTRQTIALEQIAKTLELVRLELSMMNMTRDRVIR